MLSGRRRKHSAPYPVGKAPAGAVNLVNATNSHCDCHGFNKLGFCVHLMACTDSGAELAEVLNAAAMGGTASTSDGLLSSSMEATEEQPLPIARRRRFVRTATTAGIMEDCTSKLAELQAIAQRQVAPRPGAAGATLAHHLDQLKAMFPQLPSSAAQGLCLKVEMLVAEAKELVPRFHPTHVAQQKQRTKALQRQPADRRHRALHPSRSAKPPPRRSLPQSDTATVTRSASARKFTASKPHGREPSTMRGLKNEGLHRNRKSGNLRERREKRPAVLVEEPPATKRVARQAAVAARAISRKAEANDL